MPRTDRASRVIAAPPEEVYAALVDPEALVAWLPPEGMSARFDRFEARPGGSYRLVLTFNNAGSGRGKATADSDVVEARFVSLEPGVRVVQEVDFESDDPSFAGTMTMTWEIRSVEGGTLVEVCSHHLRTPPVAPSERLGRPLPLDLESVILSCLEKEAARRPPTADAVSTHLAMCVGVDEWGESRAREWWEEHREQIRGLARGRAGSTLVSGQTLSMELSARAAGRD